MRFFTNAPLWKTGDEYTYHIFQPRHPGVANDVKAHSGRILAMIDDFHDLLVESVLFDRDEYHKANCRGLYASSAHFDQSWRARNWLHRLSAAQFERTNAVMARLCILEENLKAVTQDHARMYGEKQHVQHELHTVQDELQRERALTASLRAQLGVFVQAKLCPTYSPISSDSGSAGYSDAVDDRAASAAEPVTPPYVVPWDSPTKTECKTECNTSV